MVFKIILKIWQLLTCNKAIYVWSKNNESSRKIANSSADKRSKAIIIIDPQQGCQMVSFQTKNPNLIKFWRALRLETIDIFYGH
jgi:predicted aldo/keto reductase-like oxidoreductase